MATPELLVKDFQTAVDDTIEIMYTSPAGGNGTVITAFTATNATASNRIYSAYIYGNDGFSVNPIISDRRLIRTKFDPGGAVVNHVVPPGGTLRVKTDVASSISFNVTGKEF